MTTDIVLDFDAADNSNHYYQPMQRTLRGGLDWLRMRDSSSFRLADAFDRKPIPGQRLHISAERVEIEDPLMSKDFRWMRDRLAKFGYSFGEMKEREVFESPDLPTHLYWAKRAVDSGAAKLVAGKFPDPLPAGARIDFFSQGPRPAEKRFEDLMHQNRMLISLLAVQLGSRQKAEYEAMLAK